MTDKEIEIVPVRAALLTVKIFYDGKDARLRSTVDLTRKIFVGGGKLGTFPLAGDPQNVNIARLRLKVKGPTAFLRLNAA